MIFEWDKTKNSKNIEKHKIDFEDIKNLFKCPIIEKEDKRKDYGEKRYIIIGWLTRFKPCH